MSEIEFKTVSTIRIAFGLQVDKVKATIFFVNDNQNSTKWNAGIIEDEKLGLVECGNIFVISAHQIDLTLAKLVFEDYLRNKRSTNLKKV